MEKCQVGSGRLGAIILLCWRSGARRSLPIPVTHHGQKPLVLCIPPACIPERSIPCCFPFSKYFHLLSVPEDPGDPVTCGTGCCSFGIKSHGSTVWWSEIISLYAGPSVSTPLQEVSPERSWFETVSWCISSFPAKCMNLECLPRVNAHLLRLLKPCTGGAVG